MKNLLKITILLKDDTKKTYPADHAVLSKDLNLDTEYQENGIKKNRSINMGDCKTIQVECTCGFFYAKSMDDDKTVTKSCLRKLWLDSLYPGKLYMEEPTDEQGHGILIPRKFYSIEIEPPAVWKTPELTPRTDTETVI